MKVAITAPAKKVSRSFVLGAAGALAAAFLTVSLGAPRAEAAWGRAYLGPQRVISAAPPDQSWLQDVAEKPGARQRGKVAVFDIKGDDVYQPVRAAVVRALRRRGLNVTATLRPVDSAAQYRELSHTLGLAIFVDGELKGEGPRQSVLIRLRSGVTGQNITSAKFSGPTKKIVNDVSQALWTRVGSTMVRACSTASRARRQEREPLRIEAGNADDSISFNQGT